MHRNPETVPYLTEKEYEFKYSSPEAKIRAEEPQPWMTWDEWRQYMGPSMTNLMEDHFVRDYDIPEVLQERMEELAGQLGVSYSEALRLMRESIFGQETPPQIEPQAAPTTQTQGTPEVLPYTETGRRPKEGTIEIGGETFDINTGIHDGEEVDVIVVDGREVIIENKTEAIEYVKKLQEARVYSFEDDKTLTDHAKELIKRHSIEFAPEQTQIKKYLPERVGGVQFGLPESITRREESGFRRFGYTTYYPRKVAIMKHELGHVLDRVGTEDHRISDNKEFISDLLDWANEKNMFDYDLYGKPDKPKFLDDKVERFAQFFVYLMDDPDDPLLAGSQVKRWFKPFIKGIKKDW